MTMDEITEEILMHYASPYYDPVKAHEYYMRTRELKGRRSTSKLNDQGKEIWSFAKNQIKEEKNSKVEAAKNEQDAKTQEHRAKAEESRRRITEKLKELNEALTAKAKASREKNSADVNAKIKRIQEKAYPSGISKETKAKLAAARKEEIARLRGEAKTDNAKTSADTSKEKASNSQDAKAQRESVATELKGAIVAAREAYKAAKTQIDSSYEEIYQQEFDKIAASFPKASKSKKSGKGSYTEHDLNVMEKLRNSKSK